MDVAYVRWHYLSKHVTLQLLYETLLAHGIRTHPEQSDALSKGPVWGTHRLVHRRGGMSFIIVIKPHQR